MKRLFNALVKITGWPVQKILFRTKVYYEDKAVQSRRLKGPAILISNHTSVYDYAVFLFVFWRRTLRYQMAELLFRRRVLKHFLRAMGGIFVDRDAYDFSFVRRSLEILERKGVVGIFPEARLPVEGEERPLPFKTSAAYIALESGAPSSPCTRTGVISENSARKSSSANPYLHATFGRTAPTSGPTWRRSRQRCVKRSLDSAMNSKPKNNKTEKRKKAKLFSFRYFLFDFVKLTAALPTLIALRPRWHYENKEAHKKIRGAAMTVANHQSYLDPINMLLAIWYRRLHMVATENLFASRLGNWFFRRMLCIPVDKENFNIQTFREVGKRLGEGGVVTIFPEGELNAEKETIKTFRAGVVLMAMKNRVPVVPVYIKPNRHWYNRLHIVTANPSAWKSTAGRARRLPTSNARRKCCTHGSLR